MFTNPEVIKVMRNLDRFGTFADFPAPHSLFCTIIDVNIHRRRFSTSSLGRCLTIAELHQRQESRLAILTALHNFSVKEWVQTQASFRKEWNIVADMFYSAVVIFALGSMGGHDGIPWANSFRLLRRKSLLLRLNEAAGIPILRYIMLWPTLVAGFEAKKGSADERDFIDGYLLAMGRSLGAAAPLAIRVILRRFWDSSNKMSWDDCFDRPNMFTV